MLEALNHVIHDSYNRFIGFFSKDQHELNQVERRAQISAYRASARSADRLRDFDVEIGSGDRVVELGRHEAKLRARTAVLEQSTAKGALKVTCDQVIGTTLVPQMKLDHKELGITPEQASEAQRVMERIFRSWCKESDAAGKENFGQQQRAVLADRIVDGESFAIPVMKKSGPSRSGIRRRCLLIDTDRVKKPDDRYDTSNFVDGIRLGEYGEPLRYYVRKSHPFEHGTDAHTADKFQVIPARDAVGRPMMLHIFQAIRRGQTRGLTEFHAALDTMLNEDKYLTAEVAAFRMAACIGMLFYEPMNAGKRTLKKDERGMHKMSWRPGMAKILPHGYDMKPLNFDRDTGATVAPFMELVQRKAAVAMNLSYGTMTRNYSKSNFSNTRAEIMHDRRGFRILRQMVADDFCQPFLELVLEEAYLAGMLPSFVTDFQDRIDEWCQATWIATPGWDWIDPKNDAVADQIRVDMGVKSRQQIATEQGTDVEEVVLQEARLNSLREEHGLPPSNGPGPGMSPDREDEDDEDRDEERDAA